MNEIKIDAVKQWLKNQKAFSVLGVIEYLEKENDELKERIEKMKSDWQETKRKGLELLGIKSVGIDELETWIENEYSRVNQRMNNEQFSEWLVRTGGDWKYKDDRPITEDFSYSPKDGLKKVSDEIVVCRIHEKEWIEPTIELYEKDCK